MRDLMLQFSITHTLEDLDTLRCIFKKAFQEMHQHSLNEERLVDIFCRLQEANICTVELLQNVKKCAEFCKQFSSTTSKYDFYQFFYRIFDPIINSIKNSITKFKYAASIYGASIIEYMYIPLFSLDIMVYIIPIIIIVIFLFICQPSLESVTDMEQLTIFATVIHLIICGDVESNPGPEYDAEELLRKEPKVSDFQRIFIQSGAACHWQILGRALDIDVNDLIDCPHSAAVMIGTVFERWRDQHKDFTWKRIIRACEGYDQFGRVRDAIIKFLSSREAHSKYGSEPDFDCTYTGSITIHKESKENENGYLNKTVIILLIALIVLVLCNFIYQVWADLALQGQGWPRETTCRTDCEC
ncbi:PREDICTED: uncharacterized protein LOC109588798 [Amphimedon queenslandica]|nr:PREDICTED: uncharacterized protein LOC109588798 [Amphimedon queenslandica]|eukprot:XP_019860470.1 PREDICTED: uncharacterized protein LOC109588798 [Amphimedon queenslandica]